MLAGYFSPLAPAAILLLSAFILPVFMPRLPIDWPPRQKVREFGAAGLVGVAILSLLGTRFTLGDDALGEGLELLSGWNFSTTDSVAALMVRADHLSLPFLVVALLVLLSVTLLHAAPSDGIDETRHWIRVSGWLALGAMVCLLFVSANGLTLVYAAALFDVVTAFYWLRRGHRNFTIARLFLALFTAAGLILATLSEPLSPLLGLALWLRLGLYPFSEATAHVHWRTQDRLGYLGLSLAVGVYLTIRVMSQPVSPIVYWLTAVTILLSGLLTWLLVVPVTGSKNGRTQLLVWIFLAESLLILLAGPLKISAAIAFAVGLILSLVALWVTPALGRPRLAETAWSWPYLPAVCATINLIGLPLWLGWLSRANIYGLLFDRYGAVIVAIIILGEGVALSGLVRYWIILWHGSEINSRRSVVGVVALVPFLTPGLALFILSTITGIDLSLGRVEYTDRGGLAILGLLLIAGGTYYFRDRVMSRLKLPAEVLFELVSLRWLFQAAEVLLNWISKAVLRLRVTLEGQHYMGWAIFIALVGTLIILLR